MNIKGFCITDNTNYYLFYLNNNEINLKHKSNNELELNSIKVYAYLLQPYGYDVLKEVFRDIIVKDCLNGFRFIESLSMSEKFKKLIKKKH